MRNVAVLAVCQALGMSCLALSITITALVGNSLAPDPSLATFPLALQFVATAASTIPASLFMGRFGRRAGFTVGGILGVAGGVIACQAVIAASFAMFCVGAAFLGAFAAHVALYRFAAADVAGPEYRSRAISLVMVGGVASAVLGPELAKWTRELFSPILFAGGYAAIAALAFIGVVLVQAVNFPAVVPRSQRAKGRPLGEILRQPTLVVAVLCAMVAYGSMNLVMVSTPLAMVACAHPFETAAFVIQWHVVGMYAPSFVTGHLIERIGALKVISIGSLLVLGCILVNLTGIEVIQFWAALLLLGVGWNFMYVGATALLTETYRPEEQARVQAFNEFMVFGTTAVTALASGAIFNAFGWQAVNLGVVVPVILAAATVIWLSRRRA
ncbi:MFS transporter [Pelagibius litoralis]|uniref:MFS transporter n=2 Tax=Pelagibius litoralis TaxID=374515 RepID=A0A967C2G4_9PROT|nr:MFS transporter [Pelagibius litoralis]